MVVTSDISDLPFDLGAEPIVLTGDDTDDQALAEALDQSLVWLPHPDRNVALQETIDHVVASCANECSDVTVTQTLGELKRLREGSHPPAVANTLRTLVDFVGEPRLQMIQPTWAPTCPKPGEIRLFHVMPFRPNRARQATDTARAACDSVDAVYIRGDEMKDPEVIESIWREINRASHVLVDLTGFNSNVALEAGIAHTLGRPTMLTGREEDVIERLFPNVAKLRVKPYRDPAEQGIGAALKAFLS